MNVVRAAAVQMSPVLYSRAATVDKVVKEVLELGRRGVQFATFPETVIPYYPSRRHPEYSRAGAAKAARPGRHDTPSPST